MIFRFEIGLHCLIISNLGLDAKKNLTLIFANNRLGIIEVKHAIYKFQYSYKVIVDEQTGLTLTWPEPGRQIFFSRTEIYLLDARLQRDNAVKR